MGRTCRGGGCVVARGMASLLLVAFGLLPAQAGAGSRPEVIPLPDGWQPEGVATRGVRFFSGSLATGAVFEGSLKTGEGEVLVPGGAGRVAVGMKVRLGLLFVAGGPTGQGYVFDARTGDEVATFQLASGEVFINDVAVTRGAAWFTDSGSLNLYEVTIEAGGAFGEPEAIPLTGDIQLVPGLFSNANGIAATRTGRWLVIVQSSTGNLFRVDPDTGETTLIDLGGATFPGGDGILLDVGHRLWVVQGSGTVTLLDLDGDLDEGSVAKQITHPSFDVPTTIARSGRWLVVANARFGTVADPATAEYWLTQIPRTLN